jgi:dolichol-phosphate mannosyltransferase
VALNVVDLTADSIRVSVIVPTRNEAPNIAVLVDRLSRALTAGPAWEVLFVDDSDDDTPATIAALGEADPTVRLHHRPPGRRPGGLGGAVQDGFAAAAGDLIVVMDADLQHPPEVVPRLLEVLRDGSADLVVGTRYRGGGETDGLSGPWRRGVSAGSRRLVHALLPRSRPLSDPLSGLFAFDRSVVDGVHLEANGFKILLEVVAKGHWDRAADLAYHFDERHAGVSKASLHEGWLFTQHLARLARGVRPAPASRVAPLNVVPGQAGVGNPDVGTS